MKWVYIKNGNVADQLRRLGSRPPDPPEGGPDAFLGDFLAKCESPKLLMSCDIVHDDVVVDNTRAITYKISGSRFGIVGNAMLRVLTTFNATLRIILYQPDRIICGRVGAMLWLSYLMSLIMRRPFIHSRHNSLQVNITSLTESLSSALDRFCIRRAKGVICHGPFLADQVINLGVTREKVFNFDVGYRNFAAGRKEPVIDDITVSEDSRILLYIGRMAVNKGIYDLLEVVKDLHNENLDVAVIYIGSGPEVQHLKDVARNYGLTDRVLIKGRIEHNQLPDYICQSYLVITPTRSEFPEGRCMSAMEGLACGIPVVAPDYGPFPYLIKDGVNGMLYRVDDVHDMKTKIKLLLNEESRYKSVLQGAVESKKKLEKPDLTFYEAVLKAFA